MSIITAFLSQGFIGVGGSGTYPDPYDVRDGVDNGNGELGTLTSPLPANVRQGIQYGGDGTQYTGTLRVPSAGSSNLFANAFADLYEVQCQVIGTTPTVAVGAVSGVPVIIGVDEANIDFLGGGMASSGQNILQTERSEWTSGRPTKGQLLTLSGHPSGGTIVQQILATIDRDGILYITIGDNSAQ